MNKTHGTIGLFLWATSLVVSGCGDDAGGDSAAGSSSGMNMDTSSGEPTEDMGTTETPTVPADSDSGDPPDETGDSSSGGEPVDLSCEAYCDLHEATCQDFDGYANTQHCLDNCAQWPVGDAADVGGDSLGCRTYHVTVAASTDPELHCPHSGPSGDGVCAAEDAPTCDLYCTRYFNNCAGDLNLWVDMAECLDTCADWYPGEVTDDSGHSIGCRAYYSQLAAADPETHCESAGPGGGMACVLGG